MQVLKHIDVAAHEQGKSRLFALSIEAEQARRLCNDPAAQAKLLGLTTLREAGVEMFRVADLGDLGLAGYLRDGVDAREADIGRDRAKLAVLDGWVMLVHSSAFDGMAVTLSPEPALTLIGTYAQRTSDTPLIEITSEAAQTYTGTPNITTAPARQTHRTGSLVVLVLATLAALFLWWALA